jgi:phospholipid/cholesterol/gamma-HCH transport system permease protein
LLRPTSWRRPVRAEFSRSLRQAAGGGLATTVVAGGLVGVAMVYQALFYLGEIGEERQAGSILVSVLVREVAPVLVGLILLGRSGAATAEVSVLHASGQLRSLSRQGVDPFLLLVLPRAVGFAIASYTLGVVFVATSLAVGFTVGRVGGDVLMSSWEFSSTVLGAMRPTDFLIFPTKMLAIGMLVALTSVLTGLEETDRDGPFGRLPRTFTRGTLAIMLTSILLSLAI